MDLQAHLVKFDLFVVFDSHNVHRSWVGVERIDESEDEVARHDDSKVGE